MPSSGRSASATPVNGLNQAGGEAATELVTRTVEKKAPEPMTREEEIAPEPMTRGYMVADQLDCEEAQGKLTQIM